MTIVLGLIYKCLNTMYSAVTLGKNTICSGAHADEFVTTEKPYWDHGI